VRRSRICRRWFRCPISSVNSRLRPRIQVAALAARPGPRNGECSRRFGGRLAAYEFTTRGRGARRGRPGPSDGHRPKSLASFATGASPSARPPQHEPTTASPCY
jgi:hypothetical protein